MTTSHLRPRGLSEILDAAFLIVRARFAPLATGAALIMLPVMALTLLMTMYMPDQAATGGLGGVVAAEGAAAAEPPTWVALLVIPLVVASLVAYVIGFGALVHVASRAYLGEPAELGPALSHARRRFGTLLGATVMKYAMTLGLFVAVGIGAALAIPLAAGAGSAAAATVAGLMVPVVLVVTVVLLLRWAVTAPVVVNEQVGAGAALSRSAVLTRGSRLRLLGIFAVLLVLMWVAMFTTIFAGAAITQSPVAGQVLGNLASLVTYPFAAVLITVVYYDLRIRAEGFDLEVMAAGLGDQAHLPSADASARQHA